MATEKGIDEQVAKERLQTREIEMDIERVMKHKHMVTRN